MSVAEPFRFDPPPFEVALVHEHDHVRVIADGELDVETASTVRAEVLRLPARGCARVVLDLSRLRFADSSQIHLLFELEAAAALEGFAFAVRIGEGTPARRVLSLTRLEDRFVLIA